jgi:hypothetical protein
VTRRRFAARLVQLAAGAWIAARRAPVVGREVAASPVPSPAAALRIAALVERVLKLQAQAARDVLAARARRALPAALRDMEAAMRTLGVPASPAELHERAAILALLVAQFRARAARGPGRDAARDMGDRAEEIEWEAERIAAFLDARVDASRSLAGRAIDGAWRAERIGRLLVSPRAGLGGAHADDALAAAKAALQADLEALRAAAAPEASRMRAELQVAENQAAFLFAASWRGGKGQAARELEFAVKASDNAAESLQRLAALWERALQ